MHPWMNEFNVGRAFVAGEAAHVHSTLGAQGPNSGIQDAFNIAWKIALVYKGLSPASLLDTYTTERLPVIAGMFGESGSEHAYSAVDSRWQRHLKEYRIQPGTCNASQKKNVYMLGVNYRSSPIVVDEFLSTPGGSVAHSAYREMQEGVLQVGDRAPHAPNLVSVTTPNHALHHVSSGSQSTVSLLDGVAGGTRMFDIFASTHHSIIIFTPSLAVSAVQSMIVTLQEVISKELAKRVVALPDSRSEPGGHVESQISSGEDETIDVEVLVDQAGHAYRGYVVEEGEIKIVEVRPDGVVGAIVRGVAGLEGYFGEYSGREGVACHGRRCARLL
ncbi:FAD binding domain-containing protein [Pisolithus albus]|nr:FAD binding domain-containing protein [Pisolithus albus]